MSSPTIPDEKLARDLLTETLHGPVPTRTTMQMAEAVLRLSERVAELETADQSANSSLVRLREVVEGEGDRVMILVGDSVEVHITGCDDEPSDFLAVGDSLSHAIANAAKAAAAHYGGPATCDRCQIFVDQCE